MAELVCERLTGVHGEHFTTAAMQWGIDHELEAIRCFTEQTGLSVYNTGEHQASIEMNADVSCTPDGLLVDKPIGVEVKCPKSVTHLEYLSINSNDDLKSIAKEYYWQIQGSMLITGFESWGFVSYDPRFKDEKLRLKTIMIDRNHLDIEFLYKRINLAVELKKKLLANYHVDTRG